MRGWLRSILVAVTAVVGALLVPGEVRASVSDQVVAWDGAADPQIVVLGFDERTSATGLMGSTPGIPDPARADVAGHRSGAVLNLVLRRAAAEGVEAVVLVGFDSQALLEGAQDETLLAENPALSDLAIVPLLDVDVEDSPGRLPYVRHHRVDRLASDVAGVSLPLPSALGGTVRSVPMGARVVSLEAGTVTSASPRAERSTDQQSDVLVLATSARTAMLAGDHGLPNLDVDGLDAGAGRHPLDGGELTVVWTDQLDDVGDEAVEDGRRWSVEPPTGAFAGAILLVGPVGPSQANTYATPVGRLPEVLVEANALNTLLGSLQMREVPDPVEAAAALFLALAVVLVWRRSSIAGLGFALAAIAATALVGRVLGDQGHRLDVVVPAGASAAAVLLVAASGIVAGARERLRLMHLFGQYVPPSVARRLIAEGRAEHAAAGERLDGSVLFCDLRGFTPIAATLAPSDVRALLDTYYEVLSTVVFDHGGTVLQYTGDEIFAVFGAPVPQHDHARRALACARGLHAANEALDAELTGAGLPALRYGIGVHSGPLVAAHIGSSIRKQYMVIGSPVNVGSRLCGVAGAGEIVASADTVGLVGDAFDAGPPTAVELKGVSAPVPIHRIVPTAPDVPVLDLIPPGERR